MKNSIKQVVLAATAACVAATIHAASIGANFTGDDTDYKVPATTLAGVVAQTNWNNINIVGGNAVNGYDIDNDITGELKDNAGNLTTVKLQYSGNDVWHADGNPAGMTNGLMLTGILKLDPLIPPYNTTLTLTGLGSGPCDIYVYGDVDLGPLNLEVTIGGTTKYWQEPAAISDTLTLSESTTPGNYAAGNYVRFLGVTPSSGTVTITVTSPDGLSAVGIAGVQVVSASGFPASSTPPPPPYMGKIGVQFSGDNTSPANFLVPTDLAGVAAQTNWNVIDTTGGSGNLAAVQGISGYLQDDGARWTQVHLRYSGDDAWSTLGGVSTGDEKLLKGQIMSSNTVTLTFTNLPAGSYNVYVYGADINGPNLLTVQVSGNPNTYYWLEPPAFNGFFKQAAASTDSFNPGVGNFMVFSNVTAVSGTITLTFTEVQSQASSGTPDWELGISGLQLCSVSSAFPTAPATITRQPASQNALAGRTVTFNADAIGANPLSFHWQKNNSGTWSDLVNGSGISGATNNILQIANVAAGNAGQYRMRVTDVSLNSATSSVATLTLVTAAIGVDFSGDGANTGPLDWLLPTDEAGALAQTNWNVVDIRGGGDDTNIVQSSSFYLQNHAGVWTQVKVGYYANDAWNTGPAATANDKLMHGTLKAEGIPMSLSISNLGAGPYTVYLYGNVDQGPVTMSVTAGGSTYYWQEPTTYGGLLTQATNSTDSGNPASGSYLVITNLTPVSGTITITLTRLSGGPEIGIAGLQVVSPSSSFPTLAVTAYPQPVSANGAFAGSTVTFVSGGVGGTAPYTYHWQKSTGGPFVNLVNGGNISGATSNILAIQNVSSADIGSYRLQVQDAFFAVAYSTAASLTTTNLTALAVNFSGDGSGANFLFPADVAGVVPQPNWNNVDNTGGGGAGALTGLTPTLKNAQGTQTSVRLRYRGNDAWYRGSGTSANERMMRGVFKVAQNYALSPVEDLELTFTNLLPGTNYEIYIYGAAPNSTVVCAVTNLGNAYFWQQGGYTSGGGFVEAAHATTPTGLTSGNYMHFTNTANGNGVIRFDIGWVSGGDISDGYYYYGVEGMQLIAPLGSFSPTPATIETQPYPSMLYSGRTAVFYVDATTGYPPLSYQWQKFTGGSWVNVVDIGGKIVGATTDTLIIYNVSAADALPYRVVVTDANSNVATSDATSTLTIAPTPAGNTYSAWVLSKGPIAYYRLNETSGTNLFDFVGDNNGFIRPNGLVGQSGVLNPPFLGFETTNKSIATSNGLQRTSYAQLPIDLNGITNLTFTMWVWPNGDQQGAGPGLLMNRFNTGGGNQGGGLRYTGGGLTCEWNTNATGDVGLRYFTAPFDPQTNIWSFVALVISSNGATIYQFNTNSMVSAADIYPLAPGVFSADWHLGNVDDDANANQTFTGLIDEVAIFNSALSSNDIVELYTAATSGTTVPQRLNIQRVGSNVVVTWTTGTLLTAPAASGPWTTNAAATSPYTNAITGSKKFFRLQIQ